MTTKAKKRIGLIADSHGNIEATAEAIQLLKWRGADMLVHLGDFCDSVHPDRTAVMITLLQQYGVLALKGNNDSLVESILSDPRRVRDADDVTMLSFLKETPIVRAHGNILFAHSLPFDTPRACHMPIDTGGTQRAEELFNTADFHVLFCGHSHLPILFRNHQGAVTREKIPAGLPTLLNNNERYIVVVGAAAEGESALYDEETGLYERLQADG